MIYKIIFVNYFLLYFDKCIDIVNVLFGYDGDMKEEFLFLVLQLINIISFEFSKIVKNYIVNKSGLEFCRE